MRWIRSIVCAIDALKWAQGVGGLVVGLPLSMDGSTGPAAQAAKDWTHALSAALHLPAAMWDERLSSAAVNRAMIEVAAKPSAGVKEMMKVEPLMNEDIETQRLVYALKTHFVSKETDANGLGDVSDARMEKGTFFPAAFAQHWHNRYDWGIPERAWAGILFRRHLALLREKVC